MLSLQQLLRDFEIFCISLFGSFRFWAPTRFSEVNCPRYDPGPVHVKNNNSNYNNNKQKQNKKKEEKNSKKNKLRVS